MRTEKEIIDDILAVRAEMARKFGYNPFFGHNPSVIEEYDEKGNLIGLRMDPEEERLLNKLHKLEEEKKRCGYTDVNRGEYGGGTIGGY